MFNEIRQYLDIQLKWASLQKWAHYNCKWECDSPQSPKRRSHTVK